MESIKKLKKLLENVPAGKLEGSLQDEVLTMLIECWAQFDGSRETQMAPYKLCRAYDLRWAPPELSLSVDRHGAMVGGGSTRAERQRWYLDLEARTAICGVIGYKQVEPRDRPYRKSDAEKDALETAKMIENQVEDDRLKWKGENKVRVFVSHIVGGAYNRTIEGRTKRFRLCLERILLERGWKRSDGQYRFERSE